MKLYHVSENSGIQEFVPRPAPSHFEQITGPVVFAILETLLHNYLLPRDCPRVTFYKTAATSRQDQARFFGQSTAGFTIIAEETWKPIIQNTVLYLYEFPTESFQLLDENAGYYISYECIQPLAVTEINDCLNELISRNIAMQFVPNLWEIADAVAASTLNFSIIRMRNALPRESDRLQLNACSGKIKT